MLQAAFVTTSGMLHAQFGSVHIVFLEPRLQCSCMAQPGEHRYKLYLYMGWSDQTRACRHH